MKITKRPDQTVEPRKFQEEVFRLWPVHSLRTIASSTTLSSDAFILVSATTAITLTLPKVSQMHAAWFEIINITNCNVTVSGLTGENIVGSQSYLLASSYTAATLVGDAQNTRWAIISVRG